MTMLPPVVPPLPHQERWSRHIAPATAFTWLAQGWRDFSVKPLPSLAIGLIVFAVSLFVVGGMLYLGWDYLLFPALAGFMIVGPILAMGLYEKSRCLTRGEPVDTRGMFFVQAASGGQTLFIGVLLCLLMLLWMRAAVIIYALFFGFLPFPGLDHIARVLFTTTRGWCMLLVGTAVGGIFAAFSYAISALSPQMLLDRRLDALTAMGSSLALVSKNLPVMLTWAAIVLGLVLASVATGLVGLVVVFPILGHGSWHAYKALASKEGA
ncbi:DUF2189 domain-containing protein [Labrys okinawensis]|uniref:DUF2189 domain-containing protein n=1 Tax=Labrys okinawensis TaxID=346911 RepID=UPI0039BCB98B